MRKPKSVAHAAAAAKAPVQVKLEVTLDAEMIEKVKTFCQKSGMTLDYLAACALRDYMKYNQYLALTEEEDEAQLNALGRYAFAQSAKALQEQENEGP